MMDQMSQKEFWAKHASKGLQNMLRTGTVINLVWLFALVLSHLPQYASGGLGAPLLVFVGAGILTAALAGGAYVWKSRACALAVLAGSAGLLVLDAVFFDSFSGGSYFFFFFMGCFMTISAAFAYQRLWQQYKTTGQVPISPSHLTAPPGEKERARNTGTQPVGKLGGSASLYSRSEAAAKEAEAVRSAEFYANLYGQSHYGSQAIANSQAEDSGPRFPSYRFVALLLLWSVAGFTLAFFSGSFAHIFLHTKELHPTIALLRREEAAIYLRLILAVATPALSYLALVAGGVVHSARKRNRADPLSPGPAFARATTSPAALLPSYRSPNYAVGLLAFLLFLQLFFVLALFLVDEPLEDLSLLRADLTLAHAEEWEVLEGKPNAQYRRYQETGYQMEAQDGFYTMTFGKTRLRCPVDLYDGSIALDDSYFALYLPNTRTMTALYDSNRQPVTGQGNGLGRYFLEDGHWLHGSYSVRPAAEVYGYDFLNQAEKQAFDLFYGLYYAQTVIENGGTNSFVLPAALTDEEYARVQALFRTSRSFDAYANFRYDTDSRNSISKVYAGGISGSVDGKSQRYLQAGDDFLSHMPQGLSEEETIYWLASSLAAHVRPDDVNPDDGDLLLDGGITVTRSVSEDRTGYGALLNGKANSQGYSQAFHLLALKAGLDVIPVTGQMGGKEHYWNMVRLGHTWYHLDVCCMDQGDSLDLTYYLADDSQIAFSHQAQSYGAAGFVPLPSASGQSWLEHNGLRFDTAGEAVAFLLSQDPIDSQVIHIRLDAPSQRELLQQLVLEGKAGRLQALSGSHRENPVMRFAGPGFSNAPTVLDFTALRQQIPYEGPIATGTDLSRLPVLYSGADTLELEFYLNDMLGSQMIANLWHFDRDTSPDPAFILYAAARHTRPVSWNQASPAPYYRTLEPLDGQVMYGAEEGILREHLEQTARLLFGEDIPIHHGSIPSSPLARGGFYNLWEYDSLCGVYIPMSSAVSASSDFLVLEYSQEADLYNILLTQLPYRTDEITGAAGYEIGYTNLIASDDPALAGYAQDEAIRYRAVVRRMPDGSLQLQSIGINGRDYED